MGTALALSLVLGSAGAASAQLGAAPEVDPCGAEATRVARFAARSHGWATGRPTVVPRGTLGRGVVWHAYDSPACCGEGACSGASEQDDALVGAVGARLFALSAERPAFGSADPWSPRGWARFVAAARAAPSSVEEALALAWLVVVSVQTGQGLVTEVGAPDVVVVNGQDGELAVAVRAAGAAGETVRSSATPSPGGGFDVVLWTSRHVWFQELRVRPAGATADQRLRRATVRVDRRGAVTVLSDVAF